MWFNVGKCINIFFFKQKTAYEMRISDWSQTCALPIFCGRVSESLQRVCGSGHGDCRPWRATCPRASCRSGFGRALPGHMPTSLVPRQEPSGTTSRQPNPPPGTSPDRKTVVSGKRVRVRVDLGGYRTLQKKTKHLITNNT